MQAKHLPDSAQAAWQAYNAMETTKRRHITLLAGLEDRYGAIARASMTETLLLDKLLRDHDAQVTRFKDEMTALRAADSQAHTSLLGYMREINETLAPYEDASGEGTQLS